MQEEIRRFPKQEDKVIGLAQAIILGIINNPDLFPSPPVSMEDLQKMLTTCVTAKDVSEEAHAVAKKKKAEKDKTFVTIRTAMKAILRYAEDAVDYDDPDLQKIGWHGRKSKGKLLPPGDSSGLTVASKGEGGSIKLIWNRVLTGGPVAMFMVEQREKGEKSWWLSTTSYTREATIKHQTKGTTYEFRVIASNKAGNGKASNTVVVTF